MRILLIHSHYQQNGGEDSVFAEEKISLEKTEVVKAFAFNNKPGIKGAIQYFLSVWNIFAARKIRKVIKEFKPDVIHLHNWHYGIGPIVIRVAKKANVRIVLTLHNYRLLCPSAFLFNKGKVFTDSINSSFPWRAVFKKVYNNSYLQTFWLSFIIWFHKKAGTWKMVDNYIVLTEFARKLFIDSSFGVPAEKFVLKPNAVESALDENIERGSNFLFVGRLSEEKGIKVLLETFKQSNELLHIAGDGPLEKEVELACAAHPNIKYLGELELNEVKFEMQKATALLFTSIWYEGMPMTILEAFSLGTPVIGPEIGSLTSIIENNYNGIFFEAGNSKSLNEKIVEWQKISGAEKKIFGNNALATYKENYTPAKSKKLLIDIYSNVNTA